MIELRSFRDNDTDVVQRLLNDREVSRHLTSRVTYPYTQEQAMWWVQEGSHINQTWAIISDNQLVGCIGIEQGVIDEAHTGEIGYWVGKSYWGNGVATEALKLATDNIFQSGDISRITAGVFHPNTASMRVLEKSGFSLEGTFKNAFLKDGKYYDKHQFVRLNS